MTNELDGLLELQRLDQRHDELVGREAGLRAEAEHLRRRLEQEREAFAALREQSEALARDSRLKTLEVDQLDEQIREYQRRLDVDIMSYKEMTALREKIVLERRRISELEDAALRMMDQVEGARSDLASAEAHLDERTAALQAAVDDAEARAAGVREEIDANAEARDVQAGRVGDHLLRRYESLRRTVRDPVSPIHNGSCAGCNLKLSGSTIARARGGREIAVCEHCSRLLYVEE